MSDNGQNAKSPDTVRQNKFLLILLILLVVALIAAGIVIFILIRTKPEPSADLNDITSGRGTVVTEDNVQEVISEMASPVGDEQYITAMSIDWHFTERTSADAYVANDLLNSRTVYFDLFLSDTQELIYSSPFIPVGEELRGITLNKTLESGTYETILVYHLVDDNEQEITTVSVSLTIYVE